MSGKVGQAPHEQPRASENGRAGGPESDRWRTQPELFLALDDEFGFALDAAADEVNHLLPYWLGPGGIHEDALAVDWFRSIPQGHRPVIYLNMPYSNPAPWLERCAHRPIPKGGVIVTLHPYMPSEGWWRFVERAVEIRRIPHRLKYLRHDGVTQTTARFPSCLSVYRPQPGLRGSPSPRYVTWSWRP